MNNDDAERAANEWAGQAGGKLLPQLTANELVGIVKDAIAKHDKARSVLLPVAIPRGWDLDFIDGEMMVCAPAAVPGMMYAKSDARSLSERLLYALAKSIKLPPTESEYLAGVRIDPPQATVPS